jgi:hypothetical protein
MAKKRPVGITILSVLEIVGGIGGIFCWMNTYNISYLLDIILSPIIAFSFIFFLLMFSAGIFAFRLDIIGWIFQLIFLLVALVGSIGLVCFALCFLKAGLPFIGGGRDIEISDILSLVWLPMIPGLLIFYITRPKVKEQFK